MKGVIIKRILSIAMILLFLLSASLMMFALPQQSVFAETDYAEESSEKDIQSDKTLSYGISELYTKYRAYTVNTDMMYAGMVRFGNRGYAEYNITVLKSALSSDIPVYLITLSTIFTPGKAARLDGDRSYGIYRNKAAYAHITVEQAFDATNPEGVKFGGVVAQKDFSIPNYNESSPWPQIDVCPASSNLDKIQWMYTFKNIFGSTDCYSMECCYAFTLDESNSEMETGVFRLKLDYMFKTTFLFFGHRSNESLDLLVRIENDGITVSPFNDGVSA